jgi:probable DNA metabolism protein
MRTVRIQPDIDAWRLAARDLIDRGIEPDAVLWVCDDADGCLFGPADDSNEPALLRDAPPVRVPAAFADIASRASAHADPRRWAMLYRILWRICRGGERHLLSITTDPDMRQALLWCKAVGREIHKMHAFVRFRLTGIDEISGREQRVAWFEPEHRIVRLAAPFFVKRFTGMDWSILTPHECAHWDGRSLWFSPGVERGSVPSAEASDELWLSYYRSIFNPARLKVKAMQSEMPKRYWKNLPEAALIPGLIASSGERTRDMLTAEPSPVKRSPEKGYLAELHRRNREESDSDQ